MKSIALFTITILTILSCKTQNTDNANAPQIPHALQESKFRTEVIYSPRDETLIDRLYDEILEKNSHLKEIESSIEKLKESQYDSTKTFEKFNSSNLEYYSSAESYISSIKDSTLRTKLLNVISEKLIHYKTSVAKHQDLIRQIEKNNVAISDLHTILKILETSTMMEKFQKDGQPAISTLSKYDKEQKVVLKKLDSLTKF